MTCINTTKLQQDKMLVKKKEELEKIQNRVNF